MKRELAAAAIAAMASGANAINHRRAHDLFHKRSGQESVCLCSTVYETITGEPTRKLPKA